MLAHVTAAALGKFDTNMSLLCQVSSKNYFIQNLCNFVISLTDIFIVSENKVLTHPSSVDSITTSGGTEDHVSMGGFAARKALNVVSHVEQGKHEYTLLAQNQIITICGHS